MSYDRQKLYYISSMSARCSSAHASANLRTINRRADGQLAVTEHPTFPPVRLAAKEQFGRTSRVRVEAPTALTGRRHDPPYWRFPFSMKEGQAIVAVIRCHPR
jgi:hypothetical protein